MPQKLVSIARSTGTFLIAKAFTLISIPSSTSSPNRLVEIVRAADS
jgi:hypothetical protein